MNYQAILPFDENYAWEGLLKQALKLKQGERFVYYGIPNKKVTLIKIIRDLFLITSYSKEALANLESISLVREVIFMSSVIKPVQKHIHYLEKSATKHEDWRKQIYRCKDPHCRYYAQAQFVEGKEAECFKCHSLFIVPKSQLWKRNKQLICVMCSKSPKKETIKKANTAITEILGLAMMKDEPEKLIPYSETIEEITKHGSGDY